MIFFAPVTRVDPSLAPTVCGLCCPPAPPSDHWYRGRGVSLNDFEAWKPQKVGGCGWTRCPRNLVLSHVAQDTARAWFRGVGAHCADFGALWRLLGPFLGHNVDFECRKAVLDTRKSSYTWATAIVSLLMGVLPGFGAILGEEWLFWAQNCADLGGHLPARRPRPWTATGESLAQSLDLARPPARLGDG